MRRQMRTSNIEHRTSNIEVGNSNHKSAISNPKFRRPKFPRRGITLLEVLISAGVTAVGLFGVIAVIPVAAIQVKRGIIEDHKSVLGKNAASAFHVYGMRRPEFWVLGDGVTPVRNPGAFPGPCFVPPGQSFCIDPRWVAVNGPSTSTFPFSGSIAMPRITFSNAAWPPVGVPGLGTPHGMMADEVFVSQDDLAYTLPDDRTLPAVQTVTGLGSKRQSNGDFSWFATLVPRTGPLATNNDEYMLSIVVLHKRDSTMNPLPAFANTMSEKEVAAIKERTFGVAAFAGGGVGGGDITLAASTDPKELLGIYEGNWIMLSGLTLSGSADFKWYRIIGVDEFNGGMTRNVTLQGADWDRPEWLNPAAFGAPPPWPPTQATIMAGVVGVFERTMKLETSSLWTQ